MPRCPRETSPARLVEEHVSVAEWDAFNARATRDVPKAKRPHLLGAMLEGAEQRERAYVLGGPPFPVRMIWQPAGRPRYARRMREVRGGG